MAKKYKDINYDQYVAFVNTVVTNTVKSGGYEFKRFWATLAFAMIFMDYKPTHFKEVEGEDDNSKVVLINEEWNEIKSIDVLNSGFDPAIVMEMYKIIDKKLDKIFGKSEIELAATELMTAITSFVNDMNEKFKNEDVQAQMEQLSDLSLKMKNLDSKTLSAFMAKYAHESNQVGEIKASDA